MTERTLLARIYQHSQVNQIEKKLQHLIEGLDVALKVIGEPTNGWMKIDISGEDEAVALNLVAKEIGFCPTSLDSVQKFSTLKGYISNLKDSEELTVDVGVFEPNTFYATLKLRDLQAQLADGKRLALKEISELFGLCADLPITIKVTNLNEKEKRIEAELATAQVEKYWLWRESLLDRLIIIGASLNEVRESLNYLGLTRDVVSIEALGMFEHAAACKLGTDAAGLLGLVGRELRTVRLAVFNPRKIRQVMEA